MRCHSEEVQIHIQSHAHTQLSININANQREIHRMPSMIEDVHRANANALVAYRPYDTRRARCFTRRLLAHDFVIMIIIVGGDVLYASSPFEPNLCLSCILFGLGTAEPRVER